MKVEIWSDVVCPWCYIGKRHLEQALAAFPHRGEVEVVWRSFELDPGAPRLREEAYGPRLARKYGVTVEAAEAMIGRMTEAGADAGLELRFDIAQPGNTFDAHRLIHLARDRGIEGAVKERLLAATFTEGRPIGDPATLVELAGEAGLDRDEAAAVLASDTYGEAVRADEQEAAALGTTGVPFFVIDRAYGVSGAQPPATLRHTLERAWVKAAG